MIHAVQVREEVPQAVHCGDVPESKALCNELDGALAGDQDVLVMELCEHLERRVGHDNLVLSDGDIEPVTQLVRLLLPQGVPGVGDKYCRNAPLFLLVIIERAKRLWRAREHVPATHDDPVYVEHEAE